MDEWSTCLEETKTFVLEVSDRFKLLIPDLMGAYLHGSLAMGGFNPHTSDVDLLFISKAALMKSTKDELAYVCMELSGQPHPLEVHVLSKHQLEQWNHPSSFEFHYSDYWRKRFKREIYSIEADCLDEDLAAHLMITKTRGICLFGEPIKKIVPVIPEKDYLASILGDYSDCLKTIHTQPVYAILNLLRVYWFVLDGTISSKQEAGEWGMTTFPTLYNETIRKALQRKASDTFNMQELSTFALWIQQNMNRFVEGIN